MKMMICAGVVTTSTSLLSFAYRYKVGVSLALFFLARHRRLKLGHGVEQPIVAIEHVEQTHHLKHALTGNTPHINHALW